MPGSNNLSTSNRQLIIFSCLLSVLSLVATLIGYYWNWAPIHSKDKVRSQLSRGFPPHDVLLLRA